MYSYDFQNKPLTKKMVELLMECHEQEFLNLEPHEATLFRDVRSLLLREMITTQKYTLKSGKKIIEVFLTAKAREYLRGV